MAKTIKIELTINKSNWGLGDDELLLGIKERSMIYLVHSGCDLISSRIVPEDNRTIETTWAELMDRFGYEKIEEIGLNSLAMRDGLAKKETKEYITYADAKVLGIGDAEFNSRSAC